MRSLFLSKIDGRGGETLATAVLGTLLESSQPLAKKFFDLLSRKYQKDISPENLKADFEQCTVDSGEKGRIDLLLTTKNFAVGIECKILHFLGDKQPGKYQTHVAKQREDYLLLVLLPKCGESQARPILERQNLDPESHLITWEELLRELLRTEDANAESLFLLEDLRRFINDYVSALDSLANDFAAIFGSKSEQLKRDQYLLALKPFFGVPGTMARRRGKSVDKWEGYTFVKTACGIEGWFGFVNISQLPANQHPPGVEWRFVIGLSTDAIGGRQLELNPKFAVCNNVSGWNNHLETQNHKGWLTWIVTPDEPTFANAAEWQLILKPIHAVVADAIDSIPLMPR